jgi:hypothetical protein
MSEVLLADDPLYSELYDVRKEAETIGNLIEHDVMPELHVLRAQAPVHVGRQRELLGLPHHTMRCSVTRRAKRPSANRRPSHLASRTSPIRAMS